MGRSQLRYALICDNYRVDKWQIETISKLSELNDEAVCCALINIPGKEKMTKSLFGKTMSITRLHSENVVRIDCEGTIKNNSYILLKKDMNVIQKLGLDFILSLSDKQIGGEVLNLPRYGVWRFNFGQRPAAFNSGVIHEEPVTEAMLQKVLPNNQHILLKRGYFSSVKESPRQNQNLMKLASVTWPALVCRDILNDNATYLYNTPVDDSKVEERKGRKDILSLKLLKNKLHHFYRKLFCYEYWNVGIVHRPIHCFLHDDEEKLDIQWIVEREDMYLADPFVYKKGDKLRIIMEELNHKVVKGFISEATVFQNDSAEPSFRQATISSTSHMSYPYILEYGGEIFCVPETSEAMEVSIYKLNQVTEKWQKVKTIIKNFSAVDSTIIKYGELWWLFCTKANSNDQSHNNELYIFYADDLMGEWHSHLLNPVKIDIRSSRPAGTPFKFGGNLYRPAQDCSKTYGGRISLNKINRLTPCEFMEETVKYIEPNKDSAYPDGVHTISSAGEITILDGKRFDYHWSHFFRKLYKFRPTSIKKVRAQTYEINHILLKANKTFSDY
jgi:hypothetical protein